MARPEDPQNIEERHGPLAKLRYDFSDQREG
jgi:hypothetical protein